MKNFFIQKNDMKSRHWQAALKAHNINLIILPNSQILSPLYLLLYCLKHGRPHAIIMRYLNDYPSSLKTMLRVVAECFLILIGKLLSARIIWFCHNVDKESECHYPRISKFRRRLVSNVAYRIFTMDELLVPHAKRIFPDCKHKIVHTNFGFEERNVVFPPEIESWLTSVRNNDDGKQFVGLCSGTLNNLEKSRHYSLIPSLIECARAKGFKIYLLLVGPIGDYLREHDPILYTKLSSSPQIYLVDKFVNIDEVKTAAFIDFYLKALSDYSVPYSLYFSSHVSKPVITVGGGFMVELVRSYQLGFVLQDDLSNIGPILMSLHSWRDVGAKDFAESRTWQSAAQKIAQNI